MNVTKNKLRNKESKLEKGIKNNVKETIVDGLAFSGFFGLALAPLEIISGISPHASAEVRALGFITNPAGGLLYRGIGYALDKAGFKKHIKGERDIRYETLKTLCLLGLEASVQVAKYQFFDGGEIKSKLIPAALTTLVTAAASYKGTLSRIVDTFRDGTGLEQDDNGSFFPKTISPDQKKLVAYSIMGATTLAHALYFYTTR